LSKGEHAAFCLAAVLVAVTALAQRPPAPPPRPGGVRLLPLTKFYDTDGAPSARPGELVRSEAAYDYALSPEIRTVRILSGSRSAAGGSVYASGVVLFPQGAAPAGGWPVLAWAHPFVGVGRGCAPSLTANIYMGSYLSMYVKLGFAVVATDYAGLGTRFRNAYIDMRSNANDIVYSVPAARAAVPRLGRKWVVLGGSEGALAALGVAEMEAEIRDAQYLGAIAIAPPVDPAGRYGKEEGTDPASFLFLAYGIKTVFPSFDPSDMLTTKALPLYERLDASCAPDLRQSPGELLKRDWIRNPMVRQFSERNRPGQKAVFGPVLVISSESDPDNPVAATAQAVSQMCQRGGRVQFYRDQEPNPNAVITDSVQDQIAWIQARFAGAAVSTNCH
jgi:Secretory lipase